MRISVVLCFRNTSIMFQSFSDMSPDLCLQIEPIKFDPSLFIYHPMQQPSSYVDDLVIPRKSSQLCFTNAIQTIKENIHTIPPFVSEENATKRWDRQSFRFHVR
ncbi:hypothetical protein AVEN_17965-1 [Araneus ventricosus]|uniref:Uncharacterized protein n=1 Tax=Araneus ventricosus TaxID=182803 RepID=A0A4Y2USW6_ARAVE|nr:hypothetical protein AVEN_17965-1 [Araneus ventricosus]